MSFITPGSYIIDCDFDTLVETERGGDGADPDQIWGVANSVDFWVSEQGLTNLWHINGPQTSGFVVGPDVGNPTAGLAPLGTAAQGRNGTALYSDRNNIEDYVFAGFSAAGIATTPNSADPAIQVLQHGGSHGVAWVTTNRYAAGQAGLRSGFPMWQGFADQNGTIGSYEIRPASHIGFVNNRRVHVRVDFRATDYYGGDGILDGNRRLDATALGGAGTYFWTNNDTNPNGYGKGTYIDGCLAINDAGTNTRVWGFEPGCPLDTIKSFADGTTRITPHYPAPVLAYWAGAAPLDLLDALRRVVKQMATLHGPIPL